MSLETAEDSNYINRKVTIDTYFPTVEDRDPLDNRGEPERINQQRVLPSAIQTRLLGDLFSNSPPGNELGAGIRGTINVPNNASGTFRFQLDDSQGREIIAVPDISFFVGEFPTADNLWPNSRFGMGNMPTSVFNSWAHTNNKNVVTQAVIRNNTGADQIVTCICRFRIIANPGASTSSSS